MKLIVLVVIVAITSYEKCKATEIIQQKDVVQQTAHTITFHYRDPCSEHEAQTGSSRYDCQTFQYKYFLEALTRIRSCASHINTRHTRGVWEIIKPYVVRIGTAATNFLVNTYTDGIGFSD